MSDYNDMSNNQLQSELKSMEAEFEALKIKMLNDYDNLMLMEIEYKVAHDTLAERLKGQRNE